MKIGTCITCAFYHDGVYPTECRFDPPQNNYVNREKGVVSKWPHVDSDDWCGRYIDGRDKHGVRKTYNRLINDGGADQ